MPILDHFSPPLSVERVWNTFHHAWAATIARLLNRRLLLDGYFAAPNVQFGPRVEIDVGTFEHAAVSASREGSVAVSHTTLPATAVIPAVFPDTVEVVILQREGGPQVVAAIELVIPSNKDRPATRRAFVAKMSSYLQQADIEQVLREKKPFILRCMLDGIKKLQGRIVPWHRCALSVSLTWA